MGFCLAGVRRIMMRGRKSNSCLRVKGGNTEVSPEDLWRFDSLPLIHPDDSVLPI
jgi:hypothetical protein